MGNTIKTYCKNCPKKPSLSHVHKKSFVHDYNYIIKVFPTKTEDEYSYINVDDYILENSTDEDLINSYLDVHPMYSKYSYRIFSHRKVKYVELLACCFCKTSEFHCIR